MAEADVRLGFVRVGSADERRVAARVEVFDQHSKEVRIVFVTEVDDSALDFLMHALAEGVQA